MYINIQYQIIRVMQRTKEYARHITFHSIKFKANPFVLNIYVEFPKYISCHLWDKLFKVNKTEYF